MRKPHSSVKHGNVRYGSRQTVTGHPPLPAISREVKAPGKDDHDITRGAPMTGTKVPRDTTNVNGYFKNGG